MVKDINNVNLDQIKMEMRITSRQAAVRAVLEVTDTATVNAIGCSCIEYLKQDQAEGMELDILKVQSTVRDVRI